MSFARVHNVCTTAEKTRGALSDACQQAWLNWDGNDHFCISPIYVDRRDHPIITAALSCVQATIEALLDEGARHGGRARLPSYVSLLRNMRDVVMEKSPASVFPPFVFNPLAFFCMSTNISQASTCHTHLEKYGAAQPSVDEMKSRSLMVHLFTSQPSVRHLNTTGSFSSINVSGTVGRLLTFAFGTFAAACEAASVDSFTASRGATLGLSDVDVDTLAWPQSSRLTPLKSSAPMLSDPVRKAVKRGDIRVRLLPKTLPSDVAVPTSLRSPSYQSSVLVQRHGFQVVTDSTLFVVAGTNIAIGLFLTDTDADRLAAVAHNSGANGDVRLSTITSRGLQLFDRFRAERDPKCSWSHSRTGVQLTGYQFNDGFFFDPIQQRVRSYSLEAGVDKEWHRLRNLVFGSMHRLERALAPALAARRLELATQSGRTDATSSCTGIPLADGSASLLGLTSGFANDIHRDVSGGGTAELIVWRKPTLRVGHPCQGPCFAILPGRVLLSLSSSRSSMLILAPFVRHGTVPSTGGPIFKQPLHDGLGLVITSRALFGSASRGRRDQFRRLENETVAGAGLSSKALKD